MYYLLKIRQPYTVCIDFTINNIACPILHIINLIISHSLTFVIIIKYDFIIFIVVHKLWITSSSGGYIRLFGSRLIMGDICIYKKISILYEWVKKHYKMVAFGTRNKEFLHSYYIMPNSCTFFKYPDFKPFVRLENATLTLKYQTLILNLHSDLKLLWVNKARLHSTHMITVLSGF